MLGKVTFACLAISLMVTSNMYSEAATATTKAAPAGSKTTAAPAGSKTTAAPAGSKTTAAPAGSKTTAAPAGTKTTAAPAGSKTTAAPAGSKTTTTTKPPAASTTSDLIPKGFSYSCESNGDLTVNKSELSLHELKVHNPPKPSCKLENQTSAYKITGCGKNTAILVLLEANHAKRITGGRSREFQLYCHDSTKPYIVNVTLSAVAVTEPNSYTMLSTVSPSKSTLKLTMNIYEKGTNTKVTNAVIGQEMTLKIGYSGLDAVHPIKCYATHGNNSYMFWSETGCEEDRTLVGHKWEKKNSSVSIALYAFHFEQSHDVGIMCSVRVCPQGYAGTLCNLACGTHKSGKRRRRAAMAKDIQKYDVRTNIHVVDVESAIASAKGLTVNTFFVFVFAIFVKLF